MIAEKVSVIRWFGSIVVAAALLVAAGCGVKAVTAENFAAEQPSCIVVLPVQNQSVEEEAPEMFRKMLEAKLAEKGYRVPDREKVDALLTQYDVDPNEGGQVMSIVATDFAKDIECEGVFYATVMDMDKKNLWTYNSISVSGMFVLVNGRDGSELWRVDDASASKQIVTDPRNIQESAAATAAILLQGYEPLAEEAINKALAQLPNR